MKERPDFWGPLLVILLYAFVSLYGQFKVCLKLITIVDIVEIFWFAGGVMDCDNLVCWFFHHLSAC